MEERGIFASVANATKGVSEDEQIEIMGSATIMSVVENRAREVCICKIDGTNVRFILYFNN